MPHFFAPDILGMVLALSLGVPLILFPGYFLGYSLNLLSFRSQSINSKWSLAALFGITLIPILLYLPGRLISTTALGFVAALAGLAGFALIWRQRSWPVWNQVARRTKVAVSVWILLGSLSVLDIASGSNLYPSSAIIDHSYRSQVIASLSHSSSLPPTSFFFFPGHKVAFHYHYLLFLFGTAMVRIGGGLIAARAALAAVTIWVGLGLLVLVQVFIHYFTSLENKDRATRTAWLLLLVGGLDVVPFATQVITRYFSHQNDLFVVPDLEWWNGFALVSSWYDSILWQPHHIAALLSCLLGGLLLWQSQNDSFSQRALSALGAALAFASAAGTSVLVTIVFVAYLAVLTIEVSLHAPRKALAVWGAGLISLALIYPFLHELRGGSSQPLAPPFWFAVRPFLPVTLLLRFLSVNRPVVWNSAFLLALPLNYFVEFGIFFIGGLWWIWERQRMAARDIVREHLMIGLLAVSLLLSSFVYWGSEHSNDFGYRAVLPAQFILLLWTVEIIERHRYQRNGLPIAKRAGAKMFFLFVILGLVTNAANFVLMRARVALAEHSSGGAEIWPTAVHPAQLMYQLRAAYLWIHDNSNPEAVVQQNPEPYLWLEKKQYSERMAAVQGREQDTRSEGSQLEFQRTLALARSLFVRGTRSSDMFEACRSLNADYLIVQDSDPAWWDRGSYVWNLQPVFNASRVKVFKCHP